MMQYKTLSKVKDRRPEELEKFLVHEFSVQSNSCQGRSVSNKNLGSSNQEQEKLVHHSTVEPAGILDSREENQHSISSLQVQHSAATMVTLEYHNILQEGKEKAEKESLNIWSIL